MYVCYIMKVGYNITLVLYNMLHSQPIWHNKTCSSLRGYIVAGYMPSNQVI